MNLSSPFLLSLTQTFLTQTFLPFLMIIHSTTGQFFGIVIYVDDILVASSEDSQVSDFKEFLGNHFKFKDLGNPKYFLGIEIARNNTGLFISQHKYALDLVTDAGLLGCKPASTPMDPTKLVYLRITRPDITFAVNKLSQFLSNPCSGHLLAGERVLKYLKGTIGHGLFYSAQSDTTLSIFSYADWAGFPPPPLKSWLRKHRKASSSLILPEMKSIGYTPDCGTCNYLFLTLSKIGQFFVSPPLPLPHPRPLHRPPPPRPRRRPGTLRYGCLPRRSSTSSYQIVAAATPEGVYGESIAELSEARKVDAVAEVVREMM
ncbi:hypothetical protein SASPL_135345 [Salvia splendens]|uniref:Reverse transcriptase Ty1/copia-type domain-containing protein n=1 Tax=Salvia splendens TaxID=180675 RepID=A0A8X8WZY7_SALSN|nr:hypothetical protein SASPL_135345 [Salvia splendens]